MAGYAGAPLASAGGATYAPLHGGRDLLGELRSPHPRLACQFSTDEKLRRIQERIAAARWGRCEIVDSSGPLEPTALCAVLERVTGPLHDLGRGQAQVQ